MEIEIREIDLKDFDDGKKLVWETFLEFESPDYTAEGIIAFKKTIDTEDYMNMLKIYGAYENEILKGVIATRNEGSHIALFFVDGKYQGMGIGRKLFEFILDLNSAEYMTVNSSPYAVEIYHRLGFKDTDSEQDVDGIKFTPMKR